MSDDLVERLLERLPSHENIYCEWAVDVDAFLNKADHIIEELEAKLAEYKTVASAIYTHWSDSEAENADLKAKLAKAMEGLQCWDTMLDNPQYDLGEMAEEFTTIVRTTLAELTGGKNE